MFKITTKDIISLLLYSIPNTILTFAILHIINNVISGNTDFMKDYMGLVFVAVVVYTYLLNIMFQKKLNKYAYELLYRNEKKIFSQILETPLVLLERLGTQRFYTAVEDLRTFAFLPATITHSVNSILMLLLCMGYMFLLSIPGALMIVGLIIVLIFTYLLVTRTMAKSIARLREYNEDYYEYVNDVTNGFKELGISATRKASLKENYLNPNRDNAEKLDFNVSYVFLSVNLISQYGLYLVIGAALFLLPMLGFLNQQEVIAYVVVLLFIAGPINNLINMQNIYTRLMVANARIKQFLKDFSGSVDPSNSVKNVQQEFKSLEFEGVTFSYMSDKDVKDEAFSLGPINLKIEKGETLFVIGGNGSGKSTFIKLLTGLYAPTSGNMILNGEKDGSFKAGIQESMAAIFTDNHVFSHNYDDYSLEGNPKYLELIRKMELQQVVTDDKEKSARRKFSKGQSKRMSMIFSLLEDKPLLVLDEWAADQDPHFRKFFYESLLPQLKQQGKTIIAVTHDDAYFKHADRIVKFGYGKIVKNIKVKEGELLEPQNLWSH